MPSPTSGSAWTGKEVLVSGARGFIGSHLCQALGRAGAAVHGVSRTAPPAATGGIRWWQADLSEAGAARGLVVAVKPEVIFHLASRVDGSRSLAVVLDTFASNLESSVRLMAAAAELGCGRLILAGSMEEPEGDPAAVPCSPYAAAKWCSGAYARMFHRLHGLPVVTARLFMVYGPGQRDLTKLIPYVIVSSLRGEAPKLSSGRREVDWIYIDDVVEGLLKVAEAEAIEGRTVDLGSGRLVAIREVVDRLRDALGAAPVQSFGAVPDRPFERVRVADVRSAFETAGWTPRTSLSTGLERTAAWYSREYQGGRSSPDLGGEEPHGSRLGRGLLAAGVLLFAVACAPKGDAINREDARELDDPVIAAAGDISDADGRQRETSDLLVDPAAAGSAPRGTAAGSSLAPFSLAAVLTLGDNQYERGTLAEYRQWYDPTWGRVKDKTYPAPGNHDYGDPGASGYFEYFGARAGPRGKGYYSFDLGEWHLIALNSEIEHELFEREHSDPNEHSGPNERVGPDEDGPPVDSSEIDPDRPSAQVRWLRKDLAATDAECVLAYWHRPRFSSGDHGGYESVHDFWEALYEAGADVVLVGHDHDYERFAPMSPDGRRDPTHGIRQFVVGTGGTVNQEGFDDVQPNSEARAAQQWGVLKLRLHPSSYEWEFQPARGSTFSDSGNGECR